MRISQCRSCGAPIIWAQHEFTGNHAPIDAEPSPKGNIVLREMPGGDAVYGIPPHQGKVHPLYVNHFVTCPNAEQHKPRRYNKRAHTPKAGVS